MNVCAPAHPRGTCWRCDYRREIYELRAQLAESAMKAMRLETRVMELEEHIWPTRVLECYCEAECHLCSDRHAALVKREESPIIHSATASPIKT